MKRSLITYLNKWKAESPGKGRKPLILRGARQVGKTTLIEKWGEQAFRKVISINFERSSEMRKIFKEPEIGTLLLLLETHLKQKIDLHQDLLFLDEVQACPEVLERLRYFYEEIPQLALIATGSLLDFVLKKHDFSMPVGRVEFAYLGPMTYREFLLAQDEDRIVQFLDEWKVGQPFPAMIHEKCLGYLRKYFVIGGMPEAVLSWQQSGSLLDVQKIQQSLLSAFEADFGKYSSLVQVERLQKLFATLPLKIGGKTVFSKIDSHERSRDLSAAHELLRLARVVTPVYHSSCNGVPLRAEADLKFFKTLYLDVGLVSRALKLDFSDVAHIEDLTLVNQGMISEQFVGQELLASLPTFEPPELFYWAREQKSSSAEVDYVIQQGARIVPIEVKSGKTGRLKSLTLFLREKKKALGVRLNSEPPSRVKTPDFDLLSFPLYMAAWVRNIVLP
ncbi:AAA family ATPase [Bdellovibrionota bacterium FG-2]